MLKNAKLKIKIIGIVCMLLAFVCIGFGVASYRTSANAIEKRVAVSSSKCNTQSLGIGVF